jgi:hypothetical protein
MDKQQKRPSMKEINASIDAILKRKPTKKQIEELAEVIKKINEENGEAPIDSDKKIARGDDDFLME